MFNLTRLPWVSVRPWGARPTADEEEGSSSRGTSLLGRQGWPRLGGGGWGRATVILERPDSEYERGRWQGLRRCQVGLLREVNRQ